MSGFVYAIEAADGLIKIGFTCDPESRLSKIQSDNCGQLRPLACVPATVAQEGELHRLLAASRERGEWFRPSAAVRHAVAMMSPWRGRERSSKRITVDGCEASPLAQYRLLANRSRQDIAKAVGTTRQTIHRIEKGSQQPSWELASRLISEAGGHLTANDFMPTAPAAHTEAAA